MKKLQLVLMMCTPVVLFCQVIQSSKDDENKVFEKIEIEAGFKGGTAKWNEFVKKNFNFTRVENSLPDSINRFTDTAKIQFIVDKNGIIKDIKILSKTVPSFQQSCIEVFKNSPHWNPANQCGRSVNAYRKQTVIIQIDRSTGKRLVFVRE